MIIKHSNDAFENLELRYIQGRPFYLTPYGKSWAKRTQCLIFVDGLLKGQGTVVKHANDIDNYEYAIKASTKKAIPCIRDKQTRKQIWDLIEEKLSEII